MGIGIASVGYNAYSGKSAGGSVGLTLLSIPLLLAGSVVGIMSLIDFIQILMDKLLPADGNPYQNSIPTQGLVNNAMNIMGTLEKLAKLHEQGILKDDEFQQKKT